MQHQVGQPSKACDSTRNGPCSNGCHVITALAGYRCYPIVGWTASVGSSGPSTFQSLVVQILTWSAPRMQASCSGYHPIVCLRTTATSITTTSTTTTATNRRTTTTTATQQMKLLTQSQQLHHHHRIVGCCTSTGKSISSTCRSYEVWYLTDISSDGATTTTASTVAAQCTVARTTSTERAQTTTTSTTASSKTTTATQT